MVGWVGGYAMFAEGRQVRGVERARITFEMDPNRARWGTEIAGKVKAWANALTGPTSLPGKYPQLMNPPGSETGPGQLVLAAVSVGTAGAHPGRVPGDGVTRRSKPRANAPS